MESNKKVINEIPLEEFGENGQDFREELLENRKINQEWEGGSNDEVKKKNERN